MTDSEETHFPQPRQQTGVVEDISEHTYLSCLLGHVPHNHNDLPLEAVQHGGVGSLAERSFGREGCAERDVDAACDVTTDKADRELKENSFL